MKEQQSDDFEAARLRMVAGQIQRRGIDDLRVLGAMRRVPRHLFVPPEYRHLAYFDSPLAIGDGQTISQPYIVALMTSLLGLQGCENVLEVGTGSGYQAAILGLLAKSVHTIERHPNLAKRAKALLSSLGFENVTVHVGDGTDGLPAYAPYDAILVSAAAPVVPEPLLEQLADGGSMVLPVGGRFNQVLEKWERHGDAFSHETVSAVAFVPLLGKYGWREEDWTGY